MTADSRRHFDGSCHCGAIAFTYETAIAPELWPVRACQCSFCRRHGARTTSDPAGRVSFRVREEAALQRYQFGLRTAEFWLCRICGVYLAAVLTSPRGRFATLNVNALLDPPEFAEAVAVFYDQEAADHRRQRREQRWSPVA